MPKNLKRSAILSSAADQPSKIPASAIEHELNSALLAGDYLRALEVIDAAPSWMRKQPEFILIHATVLLSLGDDTEALHLLQDIERRYPRFTQHHVTLAMLYMDRTWPALALQSAKRALVDRTLLPDVRETLNQIIEQATALVQEQAASFGLSFETMQHAESFNEQAQIAIQKGDLYASERLSRDAIKIAPNWNPPHNNHAHSLYFLGRTAEAIAESEAVLARDPDNAFALSSLTLYHVGLDQQDQARHYADRLLELSKSLPTGGLHVEQVINALTLLEDTTALWKIAKRYLNAPPESLFGRSWSALAAAAVRSGKWKEALRLMEKVSVEEQSPAENKLYEELKTAKGQRQPSLAWMPPGYPGVDLLMQPKINDELEHLLENASYPLTPSQRRKLDSFFQKYPFMVVAVKRMLWTEFTHQAALQILEQLDTPEADAEILRFALSQVGSQQARQNAVMTLIQAERYNGPRQVKLWFEDQQQWRDVELNTQRIGYVDMKVRPQTVALMQKAAMTEDQQEAIALLRKAVELEPTCPIPVFNLGITLIQNGNVEEGEAFVYHSVEVDPNYMYGHASIALSKAEKGNEQEALDHLQIVTQAEVITPETFVFANMTWMVLAMQKHDLKTARHAFETAAQVDPDHPLINMYKEVLAEAETFEKSFGFLKEFQRNSAQRSHQKLLKTELTVDMDLRACLEINTKEMLVGIARFLQATGYGKKDVLVERIAGFLLNSKHVTHILNEDLSEKEREALRWLLEGEGVRPWEEFAQNYGDDVEESIYWNYHEPKSIPGRLRRTGLFYSGTLEGKQVAFIPVDMRDILQDKLK